MKQKSSALCAKEMFLSLYDAGEFEAGKKIPSEMQMAQCLGVSRMTWRKAVDLLQRDGILVSKHGSGTYLVENPPRIINDLAQLQSISVMIANAGIQERTSDITCTLRPISKEIAQFFETEQDEPFFVIERVRHADLGAICASVSYLPQKYASTLDVNNPPHSLFSYLEQEQGIQIGHALTDLFIPPSGEHLRTLLHLPQGCDAFGFRQSHFDTRGNPILYSIDCLRSDLFRFTIMRTRP